MIIIEKKEIEKGVGGVGLPPKLSIKKAKYKKFWGSLHRLHLFILYSRFRSKKTS